MPSGGWNLAPGSIVPGLPCMAFSQGSAAVRRRWGAGLPPFLESLPCGASLLAADHSPAASHRQCGGEFGVYPGGDEPGPIAGLLQKPMRHGRPRFVDEAVDQQRRIEIERFHNLAPSRRSSIRAWASARACSGWSVVAARNDDRSTAPLAAWGARISRATGTPRRVISTSSPCATASRRAESSAYCKQKPAARACATLRLRISVASDGHLTMLGVDLLRGSGSWRLGSPWQCAGPLPGRSLAMPGLLPFHGGRPPDDLPVCSNASQQKAGSEEPAWVV